MLTRIFTLPKKLPRQESQLPEIGLSINYANE